MMPNPDLKEYEVLKETVLNNAKRMKDLLDKIRLLDDITADHESRLDQIEEGDYSNRLNDLEDYNRAHS